MAKAINWNNFNQGFGESFNQTISELRRLREQREQFDQEMGFRERQLGLEQQRIEQNARYYDQLDLGRKLDIYQNLYPSQEGQPGAMTGGDIEKQFGVDIYNPEQEKGFFSPYKPETPSMPDNLWEDVTTGVMGTGDYLGQKVNILRNKLSNEERQVPVYIEPESNGGDSDSGDDGYKEPKLTESGARGLAWLKNPVFTRQSGENLIGLTKEEIANEFTTNLTSLSKDVLTSRTSKWFNSILAEYKKQGRIPTVAELDDRIVDHYEKYKTLSDKDVEELNTLMNYLSESETGLQSIYDRTK